MKILVTGGCGFIGSHVMDCLLEGKHEAVAVDKNINSKDALLGDCLDVQDMIMVMDKVSPEVVVHLVAEPIVERCNNYPHQAFGLNVYGLMNTLLAIRFARVKRFVFASSSMVYGDFRYGPCDENHPINPKGMYGGTKYAGEVLVKSFCEQYNIEWVITRLSGVYGEGDSGNRVVQKFLTNALSGKPLEVKNGEQSLDFTYVKDTAKGVCLCATKPKAKNEVFNITRGEGKSLNELAEIVKSLVPDVKVMSAEADKNHTLRGTMDITKAKKLLGYKPEWLLEDGVKRYSEWMKSEY